MKERRDWNQMRDSIIGLGEESSRRTYYPELLARVTQLEAAQESLRQSEANLRVLFNSLHDAVIVHDFEGRVLEVNDAMLAMYGVDQKSCRTYNLMDYSAPSVGDQGLEAKFHEIWSTLRSEGHALFRWKARRPLSPGLDFDVEVSLRQAFWFGQEAVVAVVRDISERLRLEAMLHQAQKLDSLGQLAGGVAHDTNNMLGVIIGYTDLLLEDAPAATPLANDLEQIRKAALHSADLTRQLLAFARKQPINPQVVDLNVLVESTHKMLRRLIGEQHALVWKPSTTLWSVWIDPSQVDQIVTNLAVNARDALGSGGTITLETANVQVDETYAHQHPDAKPGDYVVLTVTDDGHGMTPEVQARIFDPFFTTKGLGRGTGLGLATVYGIVRQNEGFISVYSALGEGTTFRIHLPKHLGENPGAQEAEVALKGGKETLLLVEDEEALLELAQRILEGAGYRVMSSSRPIEALHLMETNSEPIALLVTDLIMPGLNGSELYQRIHASRPEVRPLFLSGYPADTITLQELSEKRAGFLQKPFTRPALLAKVREILDA
ncbi:MAG: Blue-light-activated protein [Acidobacteria bacterium ADurb.Bin340]|nr:MAG: Blue-light-activated protein [Acidobacteria bacterium ADurb.Bin340]